MALSGQTPVSAAFEKPAQGPKVLPDEVVPEVTVHGTSATLGEQVWRLDARDSFVAPAATSCLSPASILRLQSAAGNVAVQRLVRSTASSDEGKGQKPPCRGSLAPRPQAESVANEAVDEETLILSGSDEAATTTRGATGAPSDVHPLSSAAPSLSSLQRSVGESAVVTLIQRAPAPKVPAKKPAVTPRGKGKTTPRPKVSKRPKPADYDRVIGRLGELITTNEHRAVRLGTYLPLAQSGARLAHSKWATAGANYKTAYDRYEAKIRQANEQAKSRSDLANVLIGVGIGVGAGLIAGAVAGAVLGTALSLAAKAVAEAAGEGLEVAGATAVEPPKPPKLHNDAGVDPHSFTVSQYERIVRLYDSAFDVAVQSTQLPLYLRRVEALRGQARLLKAGVKAGTTWEKVLIGVAAAEAAETHLRQVTYPVERAQQLIALLENEVVDTALEFEQHIWLAWMASLAADDPEEGGNGRGHDIDAIEQDVIEEYLVQIGVLGTNGIIGINTAVRNDDDEEAAAIEKAEVLWSNLYYKKYLPIMQS